MYLSKNLEKEYTSEHFSAREAQRRAEVIAFGPVIFQVSRIMVKWGILDMLREQPLTLQEITDKTGKSLYAIKCLMEASLTIGTVSVNPETERYSLSKTGWFLLNDPATRVNLDFNHDVNYMGMFSLEEALTEGKPVGLRHFGDWKTIYEGLSELPPQVQKSWFAFDHFYSDSSFDDALRLVFAHKPHRLLDVGGNTGRWSLRCVAYDPQVKVTVMDLPQQIDLMRKAIKGQPGADRIDGYGIDLLDPEAEFPSNCHYDVIWMSQFLDCFSEQEAASILRRVAKIMDEGTTLYVMETLWDRQRFEPAALCVSLTSLYFADMANGNSKMFNSGDLQRIFSNAGLEVRDITDGIGQGHSIISLYKPQENSK